MKFREIAIMTATDTHRVKDFDHRLTGLITEFDRYTKCSLKEIADLIFDTAFFIALEFDRSEIKLEKYDRVVGELKYGNYTEKIYRELIEKTLSELTPILEAYWYKIEITEFTIDDDRVRWTILLTINLIKIEMMYAGVKCGNSFKMKLYMFQGNWAHILNGIDEFAPDFFDLIDSALNKINLDLLHRFTTYESTLKQSKGGKTYDKLFGGT